MNKSIPYGRQHITKADIQAVVEVLQADYLTQGPKISEFEVAFAHYVGSKYGVAVANGTAALHLTTLALNINPGDKVHYNSYHLCCIGKLCPLLWGRCHFC